MSDFAADCKLYLQLHARDARLKKRLKVLKERIVPELQAGQKSPRSLPYILVLQKRTRTLEDWKDALKRQLKIWLKLDARVEERMLAIQEGFKTEETEALCVEINKTYAAKMGA